MIRFKQFLNEESIGEITARWTPRKMSDEEIMKWCDDNAEEFMGRGHPLFRGTGSGLSGLLNTMGLKRHSSNTSNHYTLWMDNHPSWADYPKRSASIICSTDYHTAGSFGEEYLIIPDDNSHVGVCDSSDLWGCFPKITNSPQFEDISFLNQSLRHAAVRSDSYENMINDIRSYDEDRKDENNIKVEDLEAWIKFVGADSLEEALIEALDPDAAHFQHFDAGILPYFDDREVWVSGRVMQLELSKMSETLKDYFKRKNLLDLSSIFD